VTLSGSAGGSLSLLTFGARACFDAGDAKLDGALCAGVAFADVHGVGRGVTPARDADATWWAPELGAEGRLRLSSHLALRLGAIASAPLSRQRFTIDGLGVVARPAVVGLRMAIGPEVLF
jgi:hypothetical protein